MPALRIWNIIFFLTWNQFEVSKRICFYQQNSIYKVIYWVNMASEEQGSDGSFQPKNFDDILKLSGTRGLYNIAVIIGVSSGQLSNFGWKIQQYIIYRHIYIYLIYIFPFDTFLLYPMWTVVFCRNIVILYSYRKKGFCIFILTDRDH